MHTNALIVFYVNTALQYTSIKNDGAKEEISGFRPSPSNADSTMRT